MQVWKRKKNVLVADSFHEAKQKILKGRVTEKTQTNWMTIKCHIHEEMSPAGVGL